MAGSLLDRALIYVTGKGGVGKTTVAAAIGMAAAQHGKRTIVCEVAEQDRVSRAFIREGVRPEVESELAENLWATTIDPQLALEEWLGRQVGGGLVKTLTRSSAFQYFVAAAPGAKELITIAKVWETAQLERWNKGGRTYDLVVVDAPASGHGIAMLKTPQTFGDIARVGPVRRQALKVRGMLSDPARTGYVAVALPEEMPGIGGHVRRRYGRRCDGSARECHESASRTARDRTRPRLRAPAADRPATGTTSGAAARRPGAGWRRGARVSSSRRGRRTPSPGAGRQHAA